MMHWEEHDFASMLFLPKVYSVNPITREHQTNSRWKTVYTTAGLNFFLNAKVEKDQENFPG